MCDLNIITFTSKEGPAALLDEIQREPKLPCLVQPQEVSTGPITVQIRWHSETKRFEPTMLSGSYRTNSEERS